MLLEMLKINLGIRSTAYDERLLQLLEASKSQIEQEGAQNLSEDNPLDAQLIVDYAEWLWRRRDTKEGMPRMIRYALNNRVFSEKMQGVTNG